MQTVEEIKLAIEAAIPGAGVEIVSNPSVSRAALDADCSGVCHCSGEFLRDDAELKLDFLSNVTGVDWPEKEITKKLRSRHGDQDRGWRGAELEETIEETRKRTVPGCLEAVYHLYSVEKKHGPVIIRRCGR